MVPPKEAPAVAAPAGRPATVRILDSTATLHFSPSKLLAPSIPGHQDINCPSYSFLVTSSTGRHVLFDLGVRKDWENLPPSQLQGLKNLNARITVEKDIMDILDEDGDPTTPRSKDVEAIIWSHLHFDHTGDPSKWPKSVPLVVGPDFQQKALPGYPANPESRVPSSCWEGRELREIDFQSEGNGLKIGRFDALDYFGDGSFYLLDSPGHAVGHMCGLARVHSNNFIFMGGDACHHNGEFRPTEYMPLPSLVPLPKSRKYAKSGCPGEMLERLQPQHSSTKPYYAPQKSFPDDFDVAMETVGKLEEFDAQDNMFLM